jgi:hypothetical protein
MRHSVRHDRRWLACAGLLALIGACSSKDEVVGAQCPGPFTGRATIEGPMSTSQIFGTSCAPCSSGKIRLDKHGCPIFVTVESCGGPVCLAGIEVSEADGGAASDSGVEEDGGAH